MKTNYAVKTFIWEREDSFQVRKLVSLGENLSWKDAKELRKQNKGSWIV